MKDIFKGFYSLKEEDLANLWLSKKTLYVFDTNVFLNLYGYAKQTRDDFFKLVNNISDRVWIPYHVGLEYQKNRLGVVKHEKAVFNAIDANLDKIQHIFKNDFNSLALKRRFPELYESTEKLNEEIGNSISNYKISVEKWNQEQPCVRSHDDIRDLLNRIFNNRVGSKPEDQTKLDKLYEEGKKRYDQRIPPGFKDAVKAKDPKETHFFYDGLYYEKQYGDLIIWKQIIEKAKDENIENVIFITDDAKDDWWYKVNSNGEKTIGPLAQLQAEIFQESNIKNFHMYNTAMFLKDGNTNLHIEVEQSSIADANIQHNDRLAAIRLQNEGLARHAKYLILPENAARNQNIRLINDVLKSNEIRNLRPDNDLIDEARRYSNDYNHLIDGARRRILKVDNDLINERRLLSEEYNRLINEGRLSSEEYNRLINIGRLSSEEYNRLINEGRWSSEADNDLINEVRRYSKLDDDSDKE